MSQYLRSNPLAPGDAYDEEEDEYSDLDGFVASDDEFLDDGQGEGLAMSHDYSSEICKIFGYDRRK